MAKQADILAHLPAGPGGLSLSHRPTTLNRDRNRQRTQAELQPNTDSASEIRTIGNSQPIHPQIPLEWTARRWAAGIRMDKAARTEILIS